MKTCVCCGRVIEFRKKWARSWDEIKFCSERCRRSKLNDRYDLEILALLEKRGAGQTICPSEILAPELKGDKLKMEEVRQAARRLVAHGKIFITQKGQIVDPSTARGPIRLKLIVKG